jgi:HEAT repeat protein
VNSFVAVLVARVLGLPRFVARAAFLSALFHACFVGGVTLIKSGTNALFLSRADPAQLPLLYAAVAVVVTLVTGGLTKLMSRRPLKRLFGEVIVVNALLVLLSTIAVWARVPGAPAVLYVLGEATATTGSVLFWSRLMDGFTSRDQKRVVGVVAGGGMLGSALAGLMLKLTVGVTGVVLPMMLAAVMWVVALPLLRALRSRSSSHDVDPTATGTATAPRRRPVGMRESLQALTGSAYTRAVAGLVVLLAATGAASDFVFRAAAARTGSEEDMAGLFGLLNAVVGIVVVVLQVGLTGRLLQHLGVFLFAAVVPAVLVLCSLVYAIADAAGVPWAFTVLVVLKGVEMAGAYSLHPVVVALLYNPIAPEVRSQSRTLIDGAIKKMGAAAAGIVLGLLSANSGVVSVFTVLATAAATLALLPQLRRLYVSALEARVQTRSSSRRAFSIDPADKDTRSALERGLRDPDADVVLAALDALGPTYELADDALLLLLEHADERVRSTALARVPARPDHRLAERLLVIARTPGARRPRAEAVRALARVQPGRAADVVLDFLDDDEPGVVCAALEVALRTRNDRRARERLQKILEQLGTLDLAWRRELARLMGALRDARYSGAVLRLMNDDDDSVRGLAIEAAARRGDPAHVDALIPRLGERSTRTAVGAALVRFRDGAVPALSAALDDTTLPVAVRVRVPRLLERIGTDAAAHALLFSNPRDDAYLQSRIAGSLVRIVERNADVVVERRRLDEAIGRRLVAYAAYAEAALDLDGSPHEGLRLLKRVVDDRRRQNLEIALQLLGIHRGIERMRVVVAGLLDTRRQARLDAIELLDATLTADHLRGDFLSLLDVPDNTRAVADAELRVRRLTHSRDPLLRGIAQATVARLASSSLSVPPTTTETALLPGSFELEGPDMADDLIERLFLLEDVDIFHGLSADDLLAIAALATELVVDAGHVLYREGDTSNNSLYVICDGVVELTRQGRQIMTLHAGESAGQVSFVDKGPRPVTARVSDAGSSRLLVVEREQFFDLMADRASLMHGFFDVLANRLRALIDKAGGS